MMLKKYYKKQFGADFRKDIRAPNDAYMCVHDPL